MQVIFTGVPVHMRDEDAPNLPSLAGTTAHTTVLAQALAAWGFQVVLPQNPSSSLKTPVATGATHAKRPATPSAATLPTSTADPKAKSKSKSKSKARAGANTGAFSPLKGPTTATAIVAGTETAAAAAAVYDPPPQFIAQLQRDAEHTRSSRSVGKAPLPQHHFLPPMPKAHTLPLPVPPAACITSGTSGTAAKAAQGRHRHLQRLDPKRTVAAPVATTTGHIWRHPVDTTLEVSTGGASTPPLSDAQAADVMYDILPSAPTATSTQQGPCGHNGAKRAPDLEHLLMHGVTPEVTVGAAAMEAPVATHSEASKGAAPPSAPDALDDTVQPWSKMGLCMRLCILYTALHTNCFDRDTMTKTIEAVCCFPHTTRDNLARATALQMCAAKLLISIKE